MVSRRLSITSWAVAAMLVLGAPAVSADERGFPVERFRLASGAGGLLDVEDAAGLAPNEWSMSLWLGAADDPLVVYSETDGERMRQSRLVDTRVGGDLAGSFGLTRWAELTISMPIVLYQDRDLRSDAAVGGMLEPIGSMGLGAMRLAAKLRVLRQDRHGVDLAFVPAVTFPTTTGDDGYLGDTGTSLVPELAIARSFGRFRAGLNLGYRSRPRSTVANLIVDDELFAHLGIGARLTRRLDWAVTSSFSVAASDPMSRFNQNYAELFTGPTVQWKAGVQLIAAAGFGLAEGFGTPDARILLAARITRRPPPPKPVTMVPREPAPVVDLDADDDGILDADDRCIREPGTAANHGCPDTDGDGIVDSLDKCPATAEDVDSFQDEDGCPDLDDDADGIADVSDACAREAGPADNRGCPDPDRDGDSIVDRIDTCPDEPGEARYSGCKKRQLATITEGKIAIVETVYFKLDKAIIEKRSFKLLESVASVLTGHSGIRVRIEGHTDSQGKAAHNKDLSQRRAEAVRAFLVARGIDSGRLDAVGYGPERPVADNRTKEGRAANRRVEFVIVDTSGVDVKNESNGPGQDTMETR
jgi:outer membrane protein OmpA-like peptidoglycan-associated protein